MLTESLINWDWIGLVIIHSVRLFISNEVLFTVSLGGKKGNKMSRKIAKIAKKKKNSKQVKPWLYISARPLATARSNQGLSYSPIGCGPTNQRVFICCVARFGADITNHL